VYKLHVNRYIGPDNLEKNIHGICLGQNVISGEIIGLKEV
jgi:hypothetical protein